MSEKKAIDKSNKDIRTRNWLFILYPESAPSEWRDIIEENHIQWIESPLHDKDTYTALDENKNLDNKAGSLKKPHIHIMLLFEGVKSYEQVKAITDSVNGSFPVVCHSARGQARYFAHMDNPEKAQYSPSEIIGHGGIDVLEMLNTMSSSERYKYIGEMIQFIKDNEVMEFQDILDYALSCQRDTWFPLLCDNSAYVVGLYIKSQRHRHSCDQEGEGRKK